MSILQKIKSLFTATPKEQPKSWGEYVKEAVVETPALPKEVPVLPNVEKLQTPESPEIIKTAPEEVISTPEVAKDSEFVAPPVARLPGENVPKRPFADELDKLLPPPFAYTATDFLKFGYRSDSGVVDFSTRPGTEWSWFTEYSAPTQSRPIKSWREENKIAAELLLEKHDDALAIFYDGSLASQITLLSFNDAGKIPRVYTARFKDEQQKPNALVEHYTTLSFPLRIIEISGDDFWKTRGVEMTTWFNAISSAEAVRLWARTAAGGVPLFCSGLPFVQKNGDAWFMGDHEQYFLLDTAVRSSKAEVIPAFFRYTPEQLLSYLGQTVEVLEDMGETDSHTNSFDVLKKWYPEIIDDDRALSPLAEFHEMRARQALNGFIDISWHMVKKV